MVAAHPYRRQMPWFSRNDEEYRAALEKASRNPAYQYVQALEVAERPRQRQGERVLSAPLRHHGPPGHRRHRFPRDQRYRQVATYFDLDIHDERELIAEIKAGRFHAVDLRSGQAVPAHPAGNNA